MSNKLSYDLAYFLKRRPWTDTFSIVRTICAGIINKIDLKPFSNIRNRHILLIDIIALLFIPALALTLRLERLDWLPDYGHALLLFTATALLVKLTIFRFMGLYRRYWHYASVADLTQVLLAASLSTILMLGLFIGAQSSLEHYDLNLPRTIPLLDGMLTFLAVGGFRFGLRGINHWLRQRGSSAGGRSVLVVGAGEAGTMVVRELRANSQLRAKPLGFVDDDSAKVGQEIQGLPVLGTTSDISALVKEYSIGQIIVAMPSASLATRRKIVDLCKQTGVATDSLPGIYEILAGYKTISRLPEIDVNLLLHRKPVAIDHMEVRTALYGTTVLVTGAGGSIGSELCRQIALFKPAKLILLGHGENSIFEIESDLGDMYPDLSMEHVIGDIRDQRKMNWVVKKYRPTVIFHTAAHKHVAFMQDDVEEAITNNVMGTQNLLLAAERYSVESFVLISTDKAINPSSVMGATKRIAESLVAGAAQRSGRAYVSVRFGNVLGSRGSVVPVFQRQIAAGGPVTITHPDMVRYFMTIPEAAELVLQAGVLGRGAEVFVLDMGKPVSIKDLAVGLIKMCGLKPEVDIEIRYTGIRPGEKLAEELFQDNEEYKSTKHEKIFIVSTEQADAVGAWQESVANLINLVQQTRSQRALEQIEATLLECQSHPAPYEIERVDDYL